jgi:hypothetical protein
MIISFSFFALFSSQPNADSEMKEEERKKRRKKKCYIEEV